MLAIFALIVIMNITGIQSLAKIIMYLQIFSFLARNWLPIVNPMVSIWINRPYRDAVKKFVASLFKKHSITPVQPLS
jgi:hypothetical protein